LDGIEMEAGAVAARPKGRGSRHAHPVRAACLRHGLARGILLKPIFNFLILNSVMRGAVTKRPRPAGGPRPVTKRDGTGEVGVPLATSGSGHRATKFPTSSARVGE